MRCFKAFYDLPHAASDVSFTCNPCMVLPCFPEHCIQLLLVKVAFEKSLKREKHKTLLGLDNTDQGGLAAAALAVR